MERQDQPELQVRRLRLRYPTRCCICGGELTRGSEAWWDRASKTATCVICGSGAELARDAAGTAGGSGRERFERLRKRREEEVKQRWGRRLGSLVLAVSHDPQSTRAWRKGSVGEERLGRFFERELPDSTIVLHDRRIPGTRANIDHVVVAPTGVWVIDAKFWAGKVEQRMLGPIWRRDPAVFVDGRNRMAVIKGMRRQVEAVRAAVVPDPLAADVVVRPVVCFVASDWRLLAKPFEVSGVIVTWPQKLIERIGAAGPLTATGVARIANRIGVGLPAAGRA